MVAYLEVRFMGTSALSEPLTLPSMAVALAVAAPGLLRYDGIVPRHSCSQSDHISNNIVCDHRSKPRAMLITTIPGDFWRQVVQVGRFAPIIYKCGPNTNFTRLCKRDAGLEPWGAPVSDVRCVVLATAHVAWQTRKTASVYMPTRKTATVKHKHMSVIDSATAPVCTPCYVNEKRTHAGNTATASVARKRAHARQHSQHARWHSDVGAPCLTTCCIVWFKCIELVSLWVRVPPRNGTSLFCSRQHSLPCETQFVK